MDYSHSEFWQDLKSGRFAVMIKESSRGQTVSNSAEVYNILKPLIASHDDVEVLYGIFLNSKNRIIAIEKLFTGSIDQTAVYPREIVKKIIGHKADGLIIAHNHPSGETTPSSEDQAITMRIGFVLQIMGVPLHDHVIIGNGHYSMADSGWMENVKKRFGEMLIGC